MLNGGSFFFVFSFSFVRIATFPSHKWRVVVLFNTISISFVSFSSSLLLASAFTNCAKLNASFSKCCCRNEIEFSSFIVSSFIGSGFCRFALGRALICFVWSVCVCFFFSFCKLIFSMWKRFYSAIDSKFISMVFLVSSFPIFILALNVLG